METTYNLSNPCRQRTTSGVLRNTAIRLAFTIPNDCLTDAPLHRMLSEVGLLNQSSALLAARAI